MATISQVINLSSLKDFFNKSHRLLKKDYPTPLEPHEMFCLHEKMSALTRENLLDPGLEDIRNRFYKKFLTRSAETAKNWFDAHPDFETLLDHPLLPDSPLYGEFANLCIDRNYQLASKNPLKKQAFDTTIKKVVACVDKINAQLPETYAFDDVAVDNIRLLNFFSPDFPDHLEPTLLERICRTLVSALRYIILTLHCNELSSIVRNAASASKNIISHLDPNEDGEERTSGWNPFLRQVSDLYHHFHPENSTKFRHELLFFFRFVTHPSNRSSPNNDLDLFNKFSPEELPLTDQVELAAFRKHLMELLPEIQKSLIGLRKILSSSYERNSFCSLLSCPDKTALEKAVNRFAKSYFKLVNGHPATQFIQNQACA